MKLTLVVTFRISDQMAMRDWLTDDASIESGHVTVPLEIC